MKREKEVEFRVKLSLSLQVTKFNLVADLQIMLSNVPDPCFYPECNTEWSFIDQPHIELGFGRYSFVSFWIEQTLLCMAGNIQFYVQVKICYFIHWKNMTWRQLYIHISFDFANVHKVKCSKCAYLCSNTCNFKPR